MSRRLICACAVEAERVVAPPTHVSLPPAPALRMRPGTATGPQPAVGRARVRALGAGRRTRRGARGGRAGAGGGGLGGGGG